MEYTETPQKASPEKLLEICDLLLDKGNLSTPELSERTEYRERVITVNTNYGVSLGFLERTDSGKIKLTDLGTEASLNNEDENPPEEQFRDGIIMYPFCRDALSELAENHIEDNSFLKNDIERVFRTSLGVEGSKSTISSKITTFLRTLDYAGLGEYKQGRRGKKSRLELSEEFQTLYDEMFTDESGKQEETSENTSPNREQQKQQSETPRQKLISHRPHTQTTKQGVSFDISLELSGDEDPEQVEELVSSVRRGMSRNVNETEEKTEEDTAEKDPTQESDETEGTDEGEDREPDEPERSEDETGEPEETESEDVESEASEQNETEEEENEQAGKEDDTDSTSSLSEF